MKSLLIILFTYFTSLVIMGQSMSVDIETSTPSPTMGEQFTISYVLKNGKRLSDVRIGQLNFPSPFNIVNEGSSSSNQMSVINNKVQSSTTIKYTYTLICNKIGQYKINPFSFFISGKEYKSGFLTLTVTKSTFDNKIKAADPNLFARIETNKRNVYKGEAITVVYKVYTRYTGFSIEDYEMPMTNGLWKEEIKSGNNGWPQTTKTVNGRNYYVLTLKKEVIIPQKTGEIKLEPIMIKAQVGRSFFNRGQQKEIKSNAPTLTVKALPKPQPTTFSGQVGRNYKIALTYSTTQLKTNEPLDVKLVISGKGNLDQLTSPVLDLPLDLEVFDPEIKDQVKVSSSGISGKKTFNYLVIPRHRGTFELPAYQFTYFDIGSKKYKTLTSPAETILVEKGNNDVETSTQSSGSNKKNVEILNTGIRHIKEATTLYAKKDAIYNTTIYWALIFTPFIIALVLYLLIVFMRNTTEDEAASKRKYANKNASTKLKKAAILLNENKHLEFYEELDKALTGYCSEKLLIPTASLTREKIVATLKNKKVDEQTIRLLQQTLEECEMARFSPVTHAGAKKTLTTATNIINQIERDVKK